MLKRLLFLSFLLFYLSTFGQDFVLQGNVNDAQNKPIAFANVVLLKENTIVKGTTTLNNGTFTLEGLNKATYTIKISFLGYEPFEKEINVVEDVVLETIILKENVESLEGVTVVAKKPTVRRLVDRLVFNVENSTLSNNNSLDVLKHTPGVLVHDGSITIKNTPPTIYINDRRVHLSADEVVQLLESTPANNIKSIEVITNPPAKYDAEGGAVLNIVTSKNIIAGYNGSVFGNYKQGFEFPKYSFGTSHFFKTKKLNTYVNYNISPRRDFRIINEKVNFINNDIVTTSWDSNSEEINKSSNQNINANIDYEFDDKNSISFSTNMLIAPRGNTREYVNSDTGVFNANKVLDSSFVTDIRKVDETFNLAFNINYIHKFKKEGEQLSVNMHHTNYDYSNFQNVDTDYLFPDNSLIRDNRFQTFSSQVIKINTSQLDYELPIDETAFFEAGIKASHIDSESILTQYTFEGEERTEDINNSDTFFYDESNYAAYISLAKEWEQWSLKAGVRTEYTETKGNSVSENQLSSNNYFKVFPSLHLSNKINENHEVYFNYNKRIYRPNYNQLNPFKYFLNDNAFKAGDPNLQPQIDDNYTIGYILNDTFTFELYYRYENNPAIEIVFQDNEENILKYLNTNIDRSISYGFDFMTYTSIMKNWDVYMLSSLFYYDNKHIGLESNNQLSNTDKWSVYARINNYFSVLEDKSLKVDLALLYISAIADGASIASERLGVDFNLKKVFLGDQASISIGITDIFNTQNFNQKTQYLNQDIFLKSNMENRLFTLGFNYKLGNTNLKDNKKEIELNEIDRLN